MNPETDLGSADSRLEPLFLSCSEIDHTFDVEGRRKALDIMQREKKVYQYQLFSGVEHGFALRGNVENPYERKVPPHGWLEVAANLFRPGYVKEQSLEGIVKWFDFWLSGKAGKGGGDK